MTLKKTMGSFRENFINIPFLSFLLSAGFAWFFIIQMDLLGYSAATNQYSERLFFRSVGLAQWATDGLYGTDKVGQNNIAVILVDDKDINAFGDKWPIPYFEHARVIKSIKKYKPRAIFIDIGFWEKREGEGLQELQKQICDLKETGVPVYVARKPRINSLEKDNPGSLIECAAALNIERFHSDADGLERTYLLSKDGQDSPALSLYKDYTKSSHKEFNSADFESPMKLFWVSRPIPEVNKLHAKADCELPSFSEIGQSLFEDRTDLWSSHCYYHKTLYASRLVESDGIAYSKQMLNDSLRNKIIIYGANITGSGDLIRIPTNNNAISGAYLHAMALDNLITFGEHYKKDTKWSEFVIFTIVCLFMYIFTSCISLASLIQTVFSKTLCFSQENSCHIFRKVVDGLKYSNKKFTALTAWIQSKYPKLFRFSKESSCYIFRKMVNGLKYAGKVLVIVLATLMLCLWQFVCYDATPINWIELVTAIAFLGIIDSNVLHKNIEELFKWFNGILKE